MPSIHPTAIVADTVAVADDVVIGPYCVLSGGVRLDPGVVLHSHVVIEGETHLGTGVQVFPFASLGRPGQIYKNQGAPGRLEIGARCEIREHVTINCGSPKGDLVTRIGEDCMLMIASHVAHDCQVGRSVIFANNATLGGHVEVGDRAFLGGLSAVHQFARIGTCAMISGTVGVRGDVIPYGFVSPGGRQGCFLAGLNVVGMKRAGLTPDEIRRASRVYRHLFHGPSVFRERVEALAASAPTEVVPRAILEFLKAGGTRELTLPDRSDGHRHAAE